MSQIGWPIGMHGRVNPTLPIAAELVRRGHTVTYHTAPAFSEEIAATGASALVYPENDQPLPDPPVPITLLEGLAGTALRVLPTVLAELREIRPELIVHDSLSRRFPHVGPRSYISPTATLPDGRSYLDRTAATVIALIRSHYRVAGLP